MRKILLCTDGESHSKAAEELAIKLASQFGSKLVCLYVVNSYPKKFTNEIYAVNRDECRIYLDRSQTEEGIEAFKSIENRIKDSKIDFESKLRYGIPYEEILKEIEEEDYDIIVMGKRKFKGYIDKIRSFNLPKKIFESSPITVVFASSNE